jgi:uncharacterized iron-regulated protein
MTHALPTLTVLAALLTACAQALPATDADRLTAALRSHPIALLGEVHDNAGQHALRLRALRALLEGGARPALLMEQFDREHQADLDRARARPGATADDVIAAGAPDAQAMQGWNWAFYKPYVALALEYQLPIVAVNVSRADTRRVIGAGLASLGFDPAVPDDIETPQARAIADSHCGMIDVAQARSMVGAQVARDQFMARAIESNAARGAVLLAGDGHVRRDVGVPRWLSPATRERSVSIGLLEEGDASAGAFDLAYTTPVQQRADVCEGMRKAAQPR